MKEYRLWTAVITPFLSNGQVDYDSLSLLLKEQNEAKNGLLLLGSTGESLALNEDEKLKILDFAFSLKCHLQGVISAKFFQLPLIVLHPKNYLGCLCLRIHPR